MLILPSHRAKGWKAAGWVDTDSVRHVAVFFARNTRNCLCSDRSIISHAPQPEMLTVFSSTRPQLVFSRVMWEEYRCTPWLSVRPRTRSCVSHKSSKNTKIQWGGEISNCYHWWPHAKKLHNNEGTVFISFIASPYETSWHMKQSLIILRKQGVCKCNINVM